MADWDFETFKMRMRKGRLHKNSPMPWGSFAQTDDTDLKALYEFFQSLEPVKNEIAQTVIAPEDVE
ncbi:MAG: hypothetical protein U5L96_10710 [Owenweeksia sp.]|nr:hypothetical protein [Owenweeksia sp.]